MGPRLPDKMRFLAVTQLYKLTGSFLLVACEAAFPSPLTPSLHSTNAAAFYEPGDGHNEKTMRLFSKKSVLEVLN